MERERINRREFLRSAALGAAGVAGVAIFPSCRASPGELTTMTETNARRRTALLTDPLFGEHLAGVAHPEQPARLDAIDRAAKGLDLDRLPARDATDAEILACHSRAYFDLVEREIRAGRDTLSTGDTSVTDGSLKAAVRAAGAALTAIDAVFTNQAKNAFCSVRPPGHHAESDGGMGFCIFNNAALAARYAQQKHHAQKILIADWDVHHGNGTQEIFYADPTVFYFSTHQSPWYPGTGAAAETGRGKGVGTTLNRPFPAGAGRKEILGAFRDDLLPAMEKFKPDMVIVSAGFDGRIGDPLGEFTLTDEDFADLTRLCLDIANRHARGRLIACLEGGYALDGLALAAGAHLRALCDS